MKKPVRALIVIAMISSQTAFAAKVSPPIRRLAQNEELDKLFEEDEEESNGAGANANPPPGTFTPPAPNTPPSMPPPDAGGVQPPSGFPSEQPAPPSSSGTRAGRTNRITSPLTIKTAPPTPKDSKLNMAGAEPEDITNENFPDLIDSFDYPNAEITDVVKAISQLTKKNFIIDPNVRGKVSIVAPTQITVAEAYKAFLSALAIHGFTVVPSGKFLKIKSARNAQRDSIETYSGAYFPNSDIMITRIVHLKHISADEVNKRLLRIMPSKDGEFTTYEPTNSIIITDYGTNVDRMMKILNQLDRPGFDEQLSVVPIRYAKAKDLADLITKIINKGASPTSPGGFTPGVPSFRSRGTNTGAPEELSLVAPDDRTNALIVVGNSAGIDKVKSLVKQLDYKLDPAESGGFYVYYVKYGEAEKIAQTLAGISGASASGASSNTSTSVPSIPGRPFVPPAENRSIFGGDVKIQADKATNSLVVTASKQDYETVKSLLRKIDIPRDQVFVEAIIMELNTNKLRGWNIGYYNFQPGANGIGRQGFTGNNAIGSLLDVTGRAGAILSFGSSDKMKLKLGTGGTEVEVPTLIGFINFLQTQTEGNILSTPQILALDNEDAEIEVGDKVPISQSSTTTTGGVQTSGVNFEDATIKLKITPFIRPESEAVRMKIEQVIKQASDANVKAETLKNSTTIISNRTIKTNIVVRNGDTAVLGGLMKDDEKVKESKVPVLGDIPVLGWLFKARQVDKTKINLVAFITPKIIRNQTDAHDLLNKKASQRVDWIKNNFDGRDPYGKMIEELPRRAAAPEEETARKTND